MTVRHGKSSQRLFRRSVIGTVWMMGGGIANRILKLVVYALLARLLTPGDFGVFAAAMVIFSLTEVFVAIGLSSSLIQHKELGGLHFTMSLGACVSIGIVLTALVYFRAGDLAQLMGIAEVKRTLEIASPLCLLQALLVVPQALAMRELKFALSAQVQLLSFSVGFGVVALLLAYWGMGHWSLVYGLVVQTSITVGLMTLLQRVNYATRLSWTAFAQLMPVSFGFALGHAGTVLGRNGDYFVAGRLLGENALGIYSRAYGLMETAVGAFITASMQVFLPIISSIQDNDERLRDAMRINLSVILGIYVVVSILCIVLAEEIVMILLGPQWGAVVLPFQILSLGMSFRAGWKISTLILVAKGYSYHSAACQILYAVSVVVGAWVGAGFGLPGIAVGVLAALFFTFTLSQILASRKINFCPSEYTVAFLRVVVLIAITGIPAWCVAQGMRGLTSMSILIMLVAGVCGVVGPLSIVVLRPKFLLDTYSLQRLERLIYRLSQRVPVLRRYLALLPILKSRN